MSREPDPSWSLLWKTPTSPLILQDSLERSPLLAYPTIFKLVLKLLNFWDVTSLLTTGNAELRALISRSYKKLSISSYQLASERRHAPIISSPPLHLFHSYHLDSIELLLPYWTIPVLAASPLLQLPSTLRHFTFSTPHVLQNVHHLSAFLFIPYATLFPDLETLRLQCSNYKYLSFEQCFKITTIPKRIRTLSLILHGCLTSLTGFQICHPIGELPEASLQRNSQKATSSSSTPSSQDLDPQTPSNTEPPHQYHFEMLEYFEFCGSLYVATIPHKFVPSLRHCIQYLASYPLLRSLPSRRLSSRATLNLHDQPQIPNSGLLTLMGAAFSVDEVLTTLPKTITSLKILVRGGWNNLNLALILPNLRTFQSWEKIDFDTVTFPSSLTSLWCESDSILFGNQKAPPRLTDLNVWSRAPAKDLLVNIPSTLVRLRLSLAISVRLLADQVFSLLPQTLTAFSLTVAVFSYSLLELLPRGLKELTIASKMLSLPYCLPREEWNHDGPDFDVRALPPNLTRLSLLSSPSGIRFPHYMLAELPRSLRSLTIPRVLLPVPEAAQLAEDQTGSSTPQNASSFSSSLSFFSSFFSFFSPCKAAPDASSTGFSNDSTSAQVSIEIIQEALRMLPPDCWCDINFEADTVRNAAPWNRPSNLRSLIAALVPNPRMVCSPAFVYCICE